MARDTWAAETGTTADREESRSLYDRSYAAVDLVALYSVDLTPLADSATFSVNSLLTPVLHHSVYQSDDHKPSPHLASFCFPTKSWKMLIHHSELKQDCYQHCFVLNSLSGMEMYGCCLVKYVQLKFDEDAKDSDSVLYYPVAIVLLSKYPLYETFCRRLYLFSEKNPQVFNSSNKDVQEKLVQKLYDALRSTHYPQLVLQNYREIGSIPAEVDYELLFHFLHYKTVIAIFTALLSESSVVVLSDCVSYLVPVMESLKSLLYPLKWIFTFLPLLPEGFEDILDTPQPIFVGMLKDSFKADYPALREVRVCFIEV
jgi:hypothetical protein